MYRYEFQVTKENGLHVRVVATVIAKLQTIIQDSKALRRVLLEYNGHKVPVTHFMSIVSLKVRQGERFSLYTEKEIPEKELRALTQLFTEERDDGIQKETDRLLMENSLTMEVVLAHFPVGVIIVNQDNLITYANKEAAHLLNCSEAALINCRADERIPHSRLSDVLKTGVTELAQKQVLENRMILTNRAPIIFGDQIIGAIALFQDLSPVEKLTEELHQEKTLKSQLDLVLHSVSDWIGLSDPTGKLIYMNLGLEHFTENQRFENTIPSIVGKETWKALRKTDQPLVKLLSFPDKTPYLVRLNPIKMDGEFKGAVLTLSPSDDVAKLMEQLELEKERSRYLENELSKHQTLHPAFKILIGESAVFSETLSLANRVAQSDATVLIMGESGTGKELVAKAIHEASRRSDYPFIRVNCAAIPSHLIESELFGHEKGAFTGAIQTHKGKFELANHGTIFLDEIGDLELDLQAKILRVLQEREIERVGGLGPIKLDVRVLAATHRNLEKMIDKGTFREDLYYRLNVVPIHLPPLRKRRSDLPLLMEYFRLVFNDKLNKSIDSYEPHFIQLMCAYDWPGNIRELQNVMERLMTLEEGRQLKVKDLPDAITSRAHQEMNGTNLLNRIQDEELYSLEIYEKEIYKRAVDLYPSFNQIAKVLGVTHKTVAAKVRKYQLEDLLGKKDQLS